MTYFKTLLLVLVLPLPLCFGSECGQPLLSRQIILDAHFDRAHDLVRVAFFDADHTLRDSLRHPGGFVDSVDDIAILPGVRDKLKALNQEGYLIAVVSNQAGVPKWTTLAKVDQILKATVDLLHHQGVVVHYYDFAENYDQFRKPGVGMAERLMDQLRVRFGRPIRMDQVHSFMVGDAAYTPDDRRPDGRPGSNFSNSDRIFAENLGIRFFEAAPYFALALGEGSRGP